MLRSCRAAVITNLIFLQTKVIITGYMYLCVYTFICMYLKKKIIIKKATRIICIVHIVIRCSRYIKRINKKCTGCTNKICVYDLLL